MIIKTKLILFTLALILICGTYNILISQNLSYSRSNKYGRIVYETKDFKKIIGVIEYYHNENKIDSNDGDILIINLKSDKQAVKITDFSQAKNFVLDDEGYSSLTINYDASRKAIENVLIVLDNYNRSISVQGKDQMKVNALYNDLDMQMHNSEVMLGSIEWSFIIGPIPLLVFIFGGAMFLTAVTNYKKYDAKSVEGKRSLRQILFLGSLIILTIAYFLSPITVADFFPGFLLVNKNLSFWDRYANFLGFVGFIITIVSIVNAYYKSFKKKQKNSNDNSEVTQ